MADGVAGADVGCVVGGGVLRVVDVGVLVQAPSARPITVSIAAHTTVRFMNQSPVIVITRLNPIGMDARRSTGQTVLPGGPSVLRRAAK